MVRQLRGLEETPDQMNVPVTTKLLHENCQEDILV
jgi:hypothetical protein